jgi:hypothetical protein
VRTSTNFHGSEIFVFLQSRENLKPISLFSLEEDDLSGLSQSTIKNVDKKALQNAHVHAGCLHRACGGWEIS